jgi:hypothetical protein
MAFTECSTRVALSIVARLSDRIASKRGLKNLRIGHATARPTRRKGLDIGETLENRVELGIM